MIKFIKKYKKQLKRILMFALTLFLISGLFLGVLFATGVIAYDNGFYFNIELFEGLKGNPWLYVVFFISQVTMTVVLSFMPGTSMLLISVGIVLFGSTMKCFLLCFTGVFVSSLIMDLIGRYGGSKIIQKLIGEDEYKQALSIVQEKGVVYVPVMYLLPIFPDDAICMITGMTKIKLWLHCIYILICRGIGCATIIFGSKLIPFNTFTCFYDYFLFGSACIIYISMLLKIAVYIDKRLCERWKKKKEKTAI